ncbi:putative membrane protein [Brachybacterium nesterenkovii]|uniref:Putative membrane protein n=1 Tax=Brachybacterium nesterenkovii TaxID=47847 RepID=A0A1X6X0V4_9MICO|nr:putative membrane protein [Brachybacterium nesterenkovii]
MGWITGRSGVMGDPAHARFVLNRATFFVGSPALVLVSLLDSDIAAVLGAPIVVATAAGLGTGALMLLVMRLFTKRSRVDALVTAICSSVANGGNMGFPIATYVLGSPAHALPVILFQQALYTPIYQFGLHVVTSGRRPSPRALAAGVVGVVGNPTILATVLGLVLLALDVRVPEFLLDPVHSLADLAIPGMLMAFGLSLIGSHPLAAEEGNRKLVAVATAAKLGLMPAIAAGTGLVLGLAGHDLFAVVVMAALPTAQNVFVAASRFRASETLARDTVLVTTIGTVAALLLVSALLG